MVNNFVFHHSFVWAFLLDKGHNVFDSCFGPKIISSAQDVFNKEYLHVIGEKLCFLEFCKVLFCGQRPQRFL